MSKKIDNEEMLMRVFRVAELLVSYESSHQEIRISKKHPLSQAKKSKDTLQENTKR